MMIVVIMVFVICIFLDVIMFVYGLGYYEEGNLEKGFCEFFDILLIINVVVNFLIYCVFSWIF